MAEGTRRRSARLLALQEPKNQKKPFGTNMLDDEKVNMVNMATCKQRVKQRKSKKNEVDYSL